MPAEQEGQEFWYTTFYNSQIWTGRRLFTSLGFISEALNDKADFTKKLDREEVFYFYFNFKKEAIYE